MTPLERLPEPLLRLQGITKRFPACLANDAVDLELAPGRIHALLGENGAGKSTLVKIIYGLLQPDEGQLFWRGRRVAIADPKVARRLGIGMVFQHFSLFEAMNVAENIALALPGGSRATLEERIGELSRSYGLPLDPAQRIHSLSVGERQRVEILRALLQNPQLLILDEPTSVLTPQEAERLFVTLRQLCKEGRAILYISHRLEEVRQLCHHATILRQGRVVATCDPTGETPASLARLMIGSELEQPRRPLRRSGSQEVRLEVEALSAPASHTFGVALRQVSLTVHAGEILGIAGVAGNGQAELLALLGGERRLAEQPQAIQLLGSAVGHLDAGARRLLGLAVVPEERLGHGAVPELSLADNAFLTAHRTEKLLRHSLIDRSKTQRFAQRILERFQVRAAGIGAPAQSLSGGNLQKFIVGRELLQQPKVLICAQPTWGVDAGAVAAIHQALLSLAAEGCALLLLSQDLDELLALSDRLAVLAAGKLSASFPASEATPEQLGLLMGGLHPDTGVRDKVLDGGLSA